MIGGHLWLPRRPAAKRGSAARRGSRVDRDKAIKLLSHGPSKNGGVKRLSERD
jgi:hypothetical protein